MADQQQGVRAIWMMLARGVLAVLAAGMLGACVQSKTPMLTGTTPVLGQDFQLNLFEDFGDDKAVSTMVSVFRWNGSRYAYVSGDSSDVKSMVAEPLDADTFLIEVSNASVYAYLLGRRLTEGTFRISPVDEKYLDKATQARTCVPQDSQTCTVANRAQLDAFVRASLGKTIAYTMVAVISANR